MTATPSDGGGCLSASPPASVGVSLSGSGDLPLRLPASAEGFSRGASSSGAVGTPARPQGRAGSELIDQVAGHVPVGDCPDLPVGAAVAFGRRLADGRRPGSDHLPGPTGAGTPGLRAQGLRANAHPSTPAQAAPTRTGLPPVLPPPAFVAARGGLPRQQGEDMTDFNVGDRLHMNLLPPGVADVTVTGTGVCGDDHDGTPCPKPTVHFLDPESGEPDEAHAEDFTKV